MSSQDDTDFYWSDVLSNESSEYGEFHTASVDVICDGIEKYGIDTKDSADDYFIDYIDAIIDIDVIMLIEKYKPSFIKKDCFYLPYCFYYSHSYFYVEFAKIIMLTLENDIDGHINCLYFLTAHNDKIYKNVSFFFKNYSKERFNNFTTKFVILFVNHKRKKTSLSKIIFKKINKFNK